MTVKEIYTKIISKTLYSSKSVLITWPMKAYILLGLNYLFNLLATVTEKEKASIEPITRI